MDAHQKKVLRWKRHLVAKSVKWSDDFVVSLKQRGLLSDVILSQIQVNGYYLPLRASDAEKYYCEHSLP